MLLIQIEILDYDNNLLALYHSYSTPRVGDKISIENKQGVVKEVIWYLKEKKTDDEDIMDNTLQCVYIYLENIVEM
jgi:hypothetical protein